MIEIEAPDGSVVEFPDGTDDNTIKGAMQKAYPSPVAPQGNQAPVTALGASNIGVQQGLTANFGDEIMAGLMTPIDMAVEGSMDVGAAYDRSLDWMRNREEQAREEHPVATTVGDIGGGVALGGTMAKGGATLLNAAKPTAASLVGRGAAEGAGYGTAYGLGEGEGVEDRLESAAVGAGLGAAGGAAFGAIGARGAAKAAREAVPGTEELKKQATKLYQRAEKSGLVVSPGSFGKAVDDIVVSASEAGIDKGIHTKAWSALNRLAESKENYAKLGTGPGLKDLDILRRVVRGAAASNEPDERRIAGIMIDKIDNYLSTLRPKDVTSGKFKKGTKAIKEARNLWSRMRKSEVIQDLFERVELDAPNFSGSGKENALRTQFRQLAKNHKKMRGFSPAEKRAIRRVAKGGPIENALRMLGKFAPTGVVSSTLSGGTGYMIGGPVGAVALPAAGFAARQGATRMTTNNAKAADALIRAGGVTPGGTMTPQNRALIQSLIRLQAQESPNPMEYIDR